MDSADAGAHAQGGIQRVQRRHRPQGVAADIADHGDFVFHQRVIHSPVGASGAHHGRPSRHRRRRALGFRHPFDLHAFPEERVPDGLLAEFADGAEQFLANDFNSQRFHVVLDHRVQLLDHVELLHLCREVPDHLFRQRVGHADLQHAHAVPEDFLHIQVAASGGDDADLPVLRQLNPVVGAVLRQLPELFRPLLHHRVPQLRVSRHHDVLGGLLDVVLHGDLFPLPDVHQALAVGNPGAHPQQHRRIILLAQLKGALREGVRLRRIRGLQHGHLGRHGIVPGILLVLAGVHGRVVRNAHHQPGGHARVAHGKQRVRRHVQPNVLHGAGAPHPRQACPEGRLHGHLLIGRPFGMNVVVLRQEFRNLRGGGSRIAGNQPDSAVVKPPGHRFVSDQ